MLRRIGEALAAYLSQPIGGFAPLATNTEAQLRAVLEPAGVAWSRFASIANTGPRRPSTARDTSFQPMSPSGLRGLRSTRRLKSLSRAERRSENTSGFDVNLKSIDKTAGP